MSLKHNPSIITTSWDDGHPLDLRVAELLARYGFCGTFYVPRKMAGPVMTGGEIRELSSRFEMGAHTLDHGMLDKVTDDQVRSQLSGSRQWIEDITGKPCRIFCFPGGRYRPRQLPFVCQAGFAAARTTELLSTQFPRRVNGLVLISTTVQVFPHSPLAYARNAIKRRSLPNLLRSRALFSARDWSRLAQDFFYGTVSRGGVFHLWGHSREIEQEHQWGRLEALLAMMAASCEKVTSINNSELGAYAV